MENMESKTRIIMVESADRSKRKAIAERIAMVMGCEVMEAGIADGEFYYSDLFRKIKQEGRTVVLNGGIIGNDCDIEGFSIRAYEALSYLSRFVTDIVIAYPDEKNMEDPDILYGNIGYICWACDLGRSNVFKDKLHEIHKNDDIERITEIIG